MSEFIVGADRNQTTLLGFKTTPAETGRPGYHPGTMLKLFLYGHMDRVQWSASVRGRPTCRNRHVGLNRSM
jgi:hypothetical protein